MPRIFISYRRDDSKHVTGRIYDRLINTFGAENIFRDLDSIGLGINFRSEISREISECAAILIIIGDKWVTITDKSGNQRLSNSSDLVRIEVETALQSSKLVIPILVNDAKMPSLIEIPASMKQLTDLNAAIVRDDPDFHRDMDRLIGQLPQNTDILHYYDEVIADVKSNWSATFFPTTDLTGSGIPIPSISDLNFNWGTGVPVVNGQAVPGIGADNFSALFQTFISPPKGKYKLIASSDNCIRVYVDGVNILDKWVGRALATDEVTIDLDEGKHIVTVQYGHIVDQSIIQVKIQRVKSKRS